MNSSHSLIYSNERHRVDRLFIKDIPVLLTYNLDKMNNKIIFVFHRLLENKEAQLPLAIHLASVGYTVILPDMYGHGAHRKSFDYMQKYKFEELYTDVYRTAEAVMDIATSVVSLFPRLCVSDITCIGTSIGADVALTAGCLHCAVKTVVSLIGSLNREKCVSNLYSLNMFASSDIKKKQSEILASAQKYCPISYYAKQNMLPWALFINGRLDVTMPLESVMEGYERLEKIYRQCASEDKLSMWLYKAGHQVTHQMTKDVLRWLKSCDSTGGLAEAAQIKKRSCSKCIF